MRLLVFLLCFCACTPDFSQPRYASRFPAVPWEHRKVPVWKTGGYKNPLVKKEARREMLIPKVISFDSW